MTRGVQSTAVSIGLCSLVALTAFVYWPQICKLGRIIWDGDLQERQKERIRNATKQKLHTIRTSVDNLYGRLKDLEIEIEGCEKEGREKIKLQINYIENSIEKLLHQVDTVRGDESIVTMRKSLVKYINTKALAFLDQLREMVQ
mmetsp:Transcript_9046/g.14707  ORF Transcript_9046/g.14707 Transcript_9046/m.14707 type:complete len:144 (-) Transcript_9046:2762-3193(-)